MDRFTEWQQHIEFFEPMEFVCRCVECGGKDAIDLEFVKILDDIRSLYDRPMIVTSGYRCELHPIEKAKRAPGPHNTGRAADFAVFGEDAFDLIEIALSRNIQGIGIKQHGDIDGRFIHLDMCNAESNRPRPWIWSYP